MIFISAGHQPSVKKKDSGAAANGLIEGNLTVDFRDRVCKELDKLKVRYIKDSDDETLQQYLNRIQTGNGSVVIEYHFDAAGSPSASGTTGIIEEDADRLDKAFAKEITDSVACILGVQNRGVKPESYTYHKRLALMKENGIICLSELGFITNKSDMDKFIAGRDLLAKRHAEIIVKYENIIP